MVAASFVSLSNARQVIGDMVYDPDLMVWHGNEADAARFRGLDVAPSAPAAAPATRTCPLVHAVVHAVVHAHAWASV